MRSLLIYLKDYKKETILAPLFKMLEASFELLVPLVMAAVIDIGIARQDSPYIVKMCLVLVALGIIGLVCSITAQYFSAKAAAGFGTGVRHALFEHIQSFTFTEMDQPGTVRCESCPPPVPSVSVYCVWSNDHGIYCGCKGCVDLCRGDPAFVCDRIRDHADYYASI